LVTPLVFVFGEVVPKNLFQRHADRLMYTGSTLFHASSVLFAPLATLLSWVLRPLRPLVSPAGLGPAADPRSNVAVLLREAVAMEDTQGRQSELIDRVLGLPGVALHQVMVPRNRVVSIRSDADRRRFFSVVRKAEYSRILVYDKEPRRIVGYVQVHALLGHDDWHRVGERLRSIVRLDAHESVATAIVKLQAAREAVAAVVDRSGHLLGLVTMKDLIEELTGELHEW
jgi:putative hemolysin